MNASTWPDHPKPKRISRVESLRNLFRSSEKSNSESKSKNVIIEEEDLSRYKMDKSYSEGVLKNFPRTIDDNNFEILRKRKEALSRSIQDLQKRVPDFDFIEKNPVVLKTREGMKLAERNLGMEITRRYLSSQRSVSSSSIDANKNTLQGNGNVKRSLFNVRDCDINANENITNNNDTSDK